MPTTGIIQGRLMKVFVGGVVLDDQNDSSLSLTLELDDVTTKQSTSQWREFLPSFKSGSGSVSGFISFDATEGISEAFADITGGTSVTVLYSTEVTGDTTYSQSAYLENWNVEWPTTGGATYSFDYKLTGAPTEGTVA